jgi:hypothetical protein
MTPAQAARLWTAVRPLPTLLDRALSIMPRPLLRLVRLSDDGKQTTGVLEVYRRATDAEPARRFHTLEPSWKNNARRVSCIPPGSYTAEHRRSSKYGRHFHVRGCEPARELVLIHPGNGREHTEGCILLGVGLADTNGDGDLETVESRAAQEALLALIPDMVGFDADLQIVNFFRT